MINISSDELKDLEVIGSGFFGTVYKVDDKTAYKIYHPTIKTSYDTRKDNPAIPHIERKIKLFQRKSKKIKLTSLPDDYIKINGKVGGVRIPYYDGETVYNLKNKNYSLKKNIAEQLINVHTELTRNFIYPNDTHLDNIILIDGKVKLIDLDDELTHISTLPNPIFNFTSRINLNENICRLFDSYNWPYTKEVKTKLKRNWVGKTTEKDFPQEFFQDRESITTFLIIDSSSNPELIKSIISNRQCRIIFLINNRKTFENDLLKIIDSYANLGIEIYDFVDYNDISNYLTNFNAINQLAISENNIKQYQKQKTYH